MSELPRGWVRSKLGDVASIQSGVGFPKKYQGNTMGDLPVYKVGDISRAYLGNNGIINISENYVSAKTAIEMKGKIFPIGATLFAKIGEALKLNRRVFVTKRGLADNNVMGVVSDLAESNQYVYRYLQCFDIAKLSRSTTVPSIRKGDVEDIVFPLPPLNEQTRIANKLDSLLAKVDQAQTRLEKIPTLLKRFRQSVLAAATSGELTREWREEIVEILHNDFSSNEIHSYEEDVLERLPGQWCYLPFSEAAEIKSNLVDPKLTPDAIHLAPNNIESNTGRLFDLSTVEKDGVKSNKHKFFSGQLVYSKIRPYLNKVCYVDFEGVCSADMYPIEAKVNTSFLLYYMLSQKFVDWTSNKQGRVVLPKINQKALNNIPVPTPPISEQKEIVRRVESLFTMADTVEKQYHQAKQQVDRLTQSILAKAFKGELVPQDPNDEPASELLKRIQAEREKQNAKPKRKASPRKSKTIKANKKTMKLSESPPTYLFDLLTKLGGEAQAESLWKQSELSIDDFYSKLKQEMAAQKIVDHNPSSDPSLRKLKVA